jgi:hypothetical protein
MKRLPITVALLLLFIASPAGPMSAAATSAPKEEDQRQKALIRQAKLSLDRAERAIEKDGFYSGRAALNIWRSNAIDAGNFDQKLFDTLKKRLYQASITNNRNYFNEYLGRNNFYEARICLEIWRLHSEEIGAFDETSYEKKRKQLNKAIARQKALDAQKKAEAAKKATKKPAKQKKP